MRAITAIRSMMSASSTALVAVAIGVFVGLFAGPLVTILFLWPLIPRRLLSSDLLIPFSVFLGTTFCGSFAFTLIRPTKIADRGLKISFVLFGLAFISGLLGVVLNLEVLAGVTYYVLIGSLLGMYAAVVFNVITNVQRHFQTNRAV